ncbi:MAG: putative manganese transporter [Bacteroidales bacterium]|jgi:hypothetical protein|nr:putative manganese transporter [Bacteroidales bacterium]
MKFDFFDFFSQTLIITLVVILLMMLIEYVNVKTRGKLLFFLKNHPRTQIWIGALLGLIPGCIGIFAIVSLYTHHLVTFGVLLAAAITSFGDEAFFMISLIPQKTLILVFILFGLAIMAGYIADWVSKKRKLTQSIAQEDAFKVHHQDTCTAHLHKGTHYVFGKISIRRILTILVVGTFIVSILTGYLSHNHLISDSFSIHTQGECHVHQVETDNNSHGHTHIHTEHEHSPFSGENLVFLIVAFVSFILLLTVSNHFFEEHIWNHVIRKHFLKIFIWVFVITLIMKITGLFVDVNVLCYQAWGKMILLLFALLIALLPESGPNLIILFLYMDGIIPFSTLIANSILQEGHGGLPLIAEKSKDFFKLKLIKFVIALLTGLSGLFLGF